MKTPILPEDGITGSEIKIDPIILAIWIGLIVFAADSIMFMYLFATIAGYVNSLPKL